MIDVEKLQKKAVLAKELVAKGMASSIDDAYRQIEKNFMVKESPEHFKVSNDNVNSDSSTGDTKIAAPKETEEIAAEYALLKRKINTIEESLNEITSFVNRYRESNDNNLREIDQNLKKIESQLKNTSPIQMPKEEVQTVIKKEEKPVSPRGGNLNPDDFSVEKYFSNANNKMSQKR